MGSELFKKIIFTVSVLLFAVIISAIPAVTEAGENSKQKKEYAAAASYDSEDMVSDYSLVVIEDEPVPLSAGNRDYSEYVIHVFFVFLLATLIIMYYFWFKSHKQRIIRLHSMSEQLRDEKMDTVISMFHPIKAIRYENELENCIASESTKSV